MWSENDDGRCRLGVLKRNTIFSKRSKIALVVCRTPWLSDAVKTVVGGYTGISKNVSRFRTGTTFATDASTH